MGPPNQTTKKNNNYTPEAFHMVHLKKIALGSLEIPDLVSTIIFRFPKWNLKINIPKFNMEPELTIPIIPMLNFGRVFENFPGRNPPRWRTRSWWSPFANGPRPRRLWRCQSRSRRWRWEIHLHGGSTRRVVSGRSNTVIFKRLLNAISPNLMTFPTRPLF